MANPVMVTGMFIQGDPETDQWVSSLHVTYSVDCITYYPVFDVGINQVRPTLLITDTTFNGESNSESALMLRVNHMLLYC